MPKKQLKQSEIDKIKKAKSRLKEQIIEQKEQKKFAEEINKTQNINVNVGYSNLSIIREGVKNNFAKVDKKMQKLVIALKDLKVDFRNAKTTTEKAQVKKDLILKKEEIDKLMPQWKAERKLIQNEIKQIDTLNTKPKGIVVKENLKGDAITVKGISKLYTGKGIIFRALDNVDLSIKRGTFNVILGPSGSGKTTLLNMISGLDRATKGSVIINGVNIEALKTPKLTQFRRDNIGFVFQSYNLLPSLNVHDNIEVGRSLQTDPSKRVHIKELLEKMDMQGNARKMVYELSGGQQQRVSIARALAKSPSIVIGDEPTGALDTETSVKVFELFQKINKELESTVIIVTHNPAVAKLAHRVIHIKNGKIDKIVDNKNPIKAAALRNI